jgi:tetraacyldisaccharide 4'-kinase
MGNGVLFPAGPLREPLRRLRRVHAVVLNGVEEVAGVSHTRQFTMGLETQDGYFLARPDERLPVAQWASAFVGRPLHAMAGIGHPERFFSHLAAMGLTVMPHAFADHHRYTVDDFAALPDDALVLMTEKDTVKCVGLALPDTLRQRLFAVPVAAHVDAGLMDTVLSQLPSEK